MEESFTGYIRIEDMEPSVIERLHGLLAGEELLSADCPVGLPRATGPSTGRLVGPTQKPTGTYRPFRGW